MTLFLSWATFLHPKGKMYCKNKTVSQMVLGVSASTFTPCANNGGV